MIKDIIQVAYAFVFIFFWMDVEEMTIFESYVAIGLLVLYVYVILKVVKSLGIEKEEER